MQIEQDLTTQRTFRSHTAIAPKYIDIFHCMGKTGRACYAPGNNCGMLLGSTVNVS